MPMRCRVEKSRISGRVDRPPPNKSYTHRAVFIASLAGGGSSRIDNALLSADTAATVDACRAFGADIRRQGGSSLAVRGPVCRGAGAPGIDARNSGTTMRMAAAVASLFAEETALTGDSSLQKRPMRPLLDALEGMGARCSSAGGRPPVRVRGRIAGGDVTVPGDVSSQFVSALLIAAPLTDSGINIAIAGDLVSKPYLDATIATMRRFGVSVQTLIPYRRYRVAPQAYRPAVFAVPADSSSLALLLSAAALNGDVTVGAVMDDRLPQGDEAFIDILERLGADVRVCDEWVSVASPGRLRGGRFDLSNSPDLLPPLAILALHCSGPLEIVNVGHARLKETDRIAILSRELRKLGVGVEERGDGLLLTPPPRPPLPPQPGRVIELDSENDHRLFMALCIAGTYVGGCTVTDPESVAVSYPDFVDVLNGLGARIAPE